MNRKSTSEEAQGLSADDLCDHHLETAYGDLDASRPDAAGSCAVESGGEYFLHPGYASRVGAVALLPLLDMIFSSHSPGAIQPGIFFDIRRNLQVVPWDEDLRRDPLPDEAYAEQFHDSELGDVYDLYNACNGVMLGNLLDVQKLEDLSAEEMEVLDVERLHKVWEHTATGCATCARIVRTLNEARGALRAGRNAPADRPEQ